eukprot:Skav226430  [mRNA]  locus=scaffold696:57224:58126:- [translate_table: standard]
MCFNCKANKDTIPFNDFRPGAEWRKTVLRHKGSTPTSHLVKDIPGFNGHTFHYDTLHVLEEGVASHAIGNLMFDLVLRKGHGTHEANLKSLYKKIAQQYLEQGIEASHRIRKLTLSNFCNTKAKYDSFPVLSGFKARHVRYLVPVMQEILLDLVVAEEPYTDHRYQCMKHLAALYDCMDRCGLHFDRRTSKAFQEHCNLALVHYTKCSKITLSQNLLQWSTVPKHHFLAHMAEQAAFLNPKFVSTYAGETMVGYMSSLAHSCLNGTAPHKVPEKVMWKFRLGFHLRFSHGAEIALSSEED